MTGDSYIIIFRGDRNRKNQVMHYYDWGFLYCHLEETGTGRIKLCIVMAGDSYIIIYRGDRNRKNQVMHCYGWGFLYCHLEEIGTGRN